MGMYDTFWGMYTCPHCGKEVEFEEQTKEFGRYLEDFKLGDYVARGNQNYFYDFTYECPECHGETELSIGIRNGQYVGVFLSSDAKDMDPNALENIEEGYQRKREYEKMCADKLGFEMAKSCPNELVVLKPGDTLRVLETDWKILEAYYEEPRKGIMSMLHNPTVVYRVESEGLFRVITASTDQYMTRLCYKVYKDGLAHSDFVEWLTEHDPERYASEPGSILREIPDGGVVWTVSDARFENNLQMLELDECFSEGVAESFDEDLIGEYIKSPEVNDLIKECGHTFSDMDKAAIIYNCEGLFLRKLLKLKELAGKTENKTLKKQIFDRIDYDCRSLRRFKDVCDGFIFDLLVCEDYWYSHSFHRDANSAISAGKETGHAFKVEKHQLLYDGCEVLKHKSIGNPFFEHDPAKLIDEYEAPEYPIAEVEFDDHRRLLRYSSSELPAEDALKVNELDKRRFENAYVLIPNPYDKGDRVRVIGSDKVGTVAVSQEDWKKYVDKALSSGAIDDWSDASITITYSEYDHDHVNPFYLELVKEDDENGYAHAHGK